MNRTNYENRLVATLVHLLAGVITQNFRRVSVALTEDEIRLEFVLLEESMEDREEIEDIYAEFGALMEAPFPVVLDVLVTTEALWEIPVSGRVVFGRKET